MMHESHYDLVIVGGGLIGASLACALRNRPLRVALVDAVAIERLEAPSFDSRSVVLSFGSRRIFSALDLWPAFSRNACPIRTIHVSNRGSMGFARIKSEDYRVDALGYVVENRVLGAVLVNALQGAENIHLLSNARLTGVQRFAGKTELDVDFNGVPRRISASLVAAADGQHSLVRKAVGVESDIDEYQQTAIVANVETSLPHQNVAYERFTQTGPLAMLPLTQNRVSMVWMVAPGQAPSLLALEEMEFAARLQETFGRRLGLINRVGQRASYPLALVRTRERVVPGVVFIGNAAQSLHPVAGQGFNLGLRDVAALAEVLVHALDNKMDPGSRAVLKNYDQWRTADTRAMVTITDTLARLFVNPFGPVSILRNLGLIAVDILPFVKGKLARRTMGLTVPLPRLARGLKL